MRRRYATRPPRPLATLDTLLLAAVLIAPTVRADVVFTVDSTADQLDSDVSDGICATTAGNCTLRAAIMQANRSSGAGATITLPAGTYVLTRPATATDGEDNGDLNLTTPLAGNPTIAIVGAGAGSTIIDANQIDRVLSVHASRTAIVSDLSMRNGFTGTTRFGGAISNAGTLTLAGVSITANSARVGGGVYNADTGNLTMQGCIVSTNAADTYGGGIYNASAGRLTILDSKVSTNAANALGGFGGGIDNEGTLLMNRSTVAGNSALYRGGGLYTNGLTTIYGSTFSGNHADDGGGIYVSYQLILVNSTISGNYANGDGGGIHDELSGSYLYNTTIVDNDADHDQDQTGGAGGGIYASPGSQFEVFNSLIAGNTLGNVPVYNDCYGTLEAHGTNLVAETSGCVSTNTALGLVDPATIGPLQDNGGPTATHALLAGSQAIDHALASLGCVNEFGVQLTTDQRGATRPPGPSSACDVGAFEFGGSFPSPAIFLNGFE